MKKSACIAVICQPSGREQKHDSSKILLRNEYELCFMCFIVYSGCHTCNDLWHKYLF